jgi:thiosulfate dehydrogenase [quinone] large subunit
VLLPLRAFLGVTFTFAGLQKLADHHYFDSSSPSSVQAQMRAYARTSPIHGIVTFASHHALVFGLLIALGELAVGVGTLLGLWTRAAAIGGMLLSLSFLLTASWHSHPYYLGPDVVFLFAWTPIAVAGAGDVLSLDALLAKRTRREMRLPAAGPVAVEFAVVRRLCGSYEDGRCRARGADGRLYVT